MVNGTVCLVKLRLCFQCWNHYKLYNHSFHCANLLTPWTLLIWFQSNLIILSQPHPNRHEPSLLPLTSAFLPISPCKHQFHLVNINGSTL